MLHGVNTFYVALCCVLLIFGLLMLDVRYTHQYPAVGPEGIRSARNGAEAVGLVMSATVILMPALVLMAMALYETRWLLLILFVVVLALMLVHVFAFMTMIYSRGTANRPGHPNSMANHPLRCCAEDTRIDPQSECDNAGLCNLPVPQFPALVLPLSSSQIPYVWTHVLIFWTMFVVLIFDVVLVVYLINLFVGRNTVRMAGSAVAAVFRTARSRVTSAPPPPRMPGASDMSLPPPPRVMLPVPQRQFRADGGLGKDD